MDVEWANIVCFILKKLKLNRWLYLLRPSIPTKKYLTVKLQTQNQHLLSNTPH